MKTMNIKSHLFLIDVIYLIGLFLMKPILMHHKTIYYTKINDCDTYYSYLRSCIVFDIS